MDFSTDGPHGDVAIADEEHDCDLFAFETGERYPGGSVFSVRSWAVVMACALCDDAWVRYEDGEPYGVHETNEAGQTTTRHTHPKDWECETCAMFAAWKAEDAREQAEYEALKEAPAGEPGELVACLECGDHLPRGGGSIGWMPGAGWVCDPCAMQEECDECGGEGTVMYGAGEYDECQSCGGAGVC